jgi:DNA-binding response OmpR family regulator
LVDDNPRVRSFVKPALEAEGYQVIEAEDGLTGVYLAEEESPDLIILDVMLEDPDFDGLDVCKRLREMGNRAPVIFLTVQDWADYPGTFQRAYTLGADDYIAKRQELRRVEDGMQVGPAEFLEHKGDVQELLSRVQARLRRRESGLQPVDNPEQAYGELIRIDFENSEVHVRRRDVWEQSNLTRTELAILRLLTNRAGRTVGRHQIIDFVERARDSAEEEETMTERSLETHIHRLRQKLEPESGQHQVIHTVPGLGYRFQVPDQGRS